MTARRKGHRSDDSDRRRSARIAEDLMVRTTTADGEIAIACAGELSENGLFVEYILPYERGTKVQVEFDLPGGGSVHADAVVASVETFLPDDLSRKPGNGLRFEDLPTGTRAAIRVFIDRSLE